MTALSDKGKPTIIPEERHTFRAGRFGTIPSRYIDECICGSLKNDPVHKVVKSLVHSDIPVKPVTSILRYLSKKLIKQATDYSNLSQWIQIQIWDYCNVRLGVANHLKPESAEEVADRIIKRVLKTYAIKKH